MHAIVEGISRKLGELREATSDTFRIYDDMVEQNFKPHSFFVRILGTRPLRETPFSYRKVVDVVVEYYAPDENLRERADALINPVFDALEYIEVYGLTLRVHEANIDPTDYGFSFTGTYQYWVVDDRDEEAMYEWQVNHKVKE